MLRCADPENSVRAPKEESIIIQRVNFLFSPEMLNHVLLMSVCTLATFITNVKRVCAVMAFILGTIN